MFCISCGAKNKLEAKFCATCGAKTVSPSEPQDLPESQITSEPQKTLQTNSRKILGLKPVLFGVVAGGLAIVVLLSGLLVSGLLNRPMPTESTAREFLLSSTDVASYNLEYLSNQVDYTTTTSSFIYGNCPAKNQLQVALAAGSSWANQGYMELGGDSSDFSISTQIISYSSESAAQAVIDAAIDGSIDSSCDTPSIQDYYSGGKKISEDYGVNVEGVTLVDTYGSEKFHLVLARRGAALLVFDIRRSESAQDISPSDVHDLIVKALNKFTGN